MRTGSLTSVQYSVPMSGDRQEKHTFNEWHRDLGIVIDGSLVEKLTVRLDAGIPSITLRDGTLLIDKFCERLTRHARQTYDATLDNCGDELMKYDRDMNLHVFTSAMKPFSGNAAVASPS